MKINDITYNFDGGTVGVFTDGGDYYIDQRLFVEDRGVIWNGYPEGKTSFVVEDQQGVKKLILEASLLYAKEQNEVGYIEWVRKAFNE